MSFQYPRYGNSGHYSANIGTVRSTNTREDQTARIAARRSLESTQVLNLPMRLAVANDVHHVDGGYHDFLQVEEGRPDFGLQNEASRDELSPEEHLFAGSNAFYADNYPLTQSAPIMPPGYTDNGYTDPPHNISPSSGLITPHTGQSHQPYYPYSEAGPAGYSPSPASQSDDNQAKRARNTAASARFRAKKKEREQELERRTTKINETVTKLEAKVVRLETENRWLKDLVTGKIKTPVEEREKDNSRKNDKVVDNWESHRHTDGVGTRKSGRLN